MYQSVEESTIMEIKKVYDFVIYLPHIFYLVPFLFLGIGIYLLLNLKNPYVDKRFNLILFGVVFSVLGLLVSVMCSFDVVSNYKDIVIPYCNGEYLEVEGQVENLEIEPFLGKGNDSFSVNGIEFDIGSSTKPGYQKQAAYGGKITENGQEVKIKYIEAHGFNYIMSLSIVE